jgi:hypothetical protein
MPARPKWWHTLQGSRREALLAVDLYNRAACERSLEGFVVHMNLAWLYLHHAKFVHEKVDFRYRKANGRLERIDGEVKTWDLARCLRETFPDNSPVRANVEFFLKIRNKIEHRYEKLLADVLAGKTQALVLNFEETLTAWFGSGQGLGDSLRFPVFMSSLTPDAVKALKATHRKLPKKLTSFIQEHDASLPAAVAEDYRYDFRVYLLPQTGPKTDSDVVMRFLREDEMTDEQRQARDVVQTITRNKLVSVQNKGKHKPGAVARSVSEGLKVRFSVQGHHVPAWRYYEVRPETAADRPELTDERHCVWDEPHGDYLYTDAWIKKLIKELADPKTFKKVTGKKPEPTGGKV